MKIFKSLAILGLCLETLSPLYAAEMMQLHRYTSIAAWSANTYWIETDKHLVLIDAQLLATDGKLLARQLQSRGKPIAGVFITHPHVDHFAGLAALQDAFGKFPVYASQATADEMENAFHSFLNNGYGAPFGEQVERRFVAADHILKNHQAIVVDGISLVLDDLGAGESFDNSTFYVPQKDWLFSGDATLHQHHYYVGEGRTNQVVAQLDYLQRQYPKAHFYSGHGEPADSVLITQQKQYVEWTQKLVREAIYDSANLTADKKHLKKEVRDQLSHEIIRQYPYLGTYGFDAHQFVLMNLYGVENELLAGLIATTAVAKK